MLQWHAEGCRGGSCVYQPYEGVCTEECDFVASTSAAGKLFDINANPNHAQASHKRLEIRQVRMHCG
eukprot:3861735-Amphidinium_carterae.1